MSKKSKKTNWLNRTLISGPFFCLVTNQKDFDRAVKQLNGNQCDYVLRGSDATTHTFIKDGDITCIVAIKLDEEKSTTQHLSLLVHEATHIMQEFNNWIGEKFPSSEYQAYSMQAICEGLFNEYFRVVGK